MDNLYDQVPKGNQPKKRGLGKKNESLLRAFFEKQGEHKQPPRPVKKGKPGRPVTRNHPKGAQRVAEGYQKYIITVKSDYIEDMKQIAFVRGIQIKGAFEEAIEAYLQASEWVKSVKKRL